MKTDDEYVKDLDGINRYMLGCKSVIDMFNSHTEKELIDTCWDVNALKNDINNVDAAELIDTCWDVNLAVSLGISLEELN